MTGTASSPDERLLLLVTRYQTRRDERALAELFDRTAPRLMSFAVSMTRDGALAEDAVQEVFLDLVRGAAVHDRARPVLPWLLGVTRLKVLRALRSQRRSTVPVRLLGRSADEVEALAPTGTDHGAPDGGVAPAAAGEAAGEAAPLDRALSALDEPYRSTARLRFQYGLSTDAIAELRDEAPGTTRSALSRGVAHLRRRLAGPSALAVALPPQLSALRARVLAAHQMAVVPVAAGGLLAVKLATGVLLGALAGAGATWVGAPRAAPAPPAEVARAAGPVDGAPASAGERPVGAPGDAQALSLRGAPPAHGDADLAADRPAGAAPRPGGRAGGPAPGAAAGGQASGELTLEGGGFVITFGDGPRVRTLAGLARRLALEEPVQRDAAWVVETLRGELRDLRRLPDADGRTWESVQLAGARLVEGVLEVDGSEAVSFRDRLIPGRSETFGQAERRLLDTGRRRLRRLIPLERLDAFDALQTDLLFGPLPPGAPAEPERKPVERP